MRSSALEQLQCSRLYFSYFRYSYNAISMHCKHAFCSTGVINDLYLHLYYVLHFTLFEQWIERETAQFSIFVLLFKSRLQMRQERFKSVLTLQIHFTKSIFLLITGATTVNSILNSVFYIHEPPGGLEYTCFSVNAEFCRTFLALDFNITA